MPNSWLLTGYARRLKIISQILQCAASHHVRLHGQSISAPYDACRRGLRFSSLSHSARRKTDMLSVPRPTRGALRPRGGSNSLLWSGLWAICVSRKWQTRPVMRIVHITFSALMYTHATVLQGWVSFRTPPRYLTPAPPREIVW